VQHASPSRLVLHVERRSVSNADTIILILIIILIIMMMIIIQITDTCSRRNLLCKLLYAAPIRYQLVIKTEHRIGLNRLDYV